MLEVTAKLRMWGNEPFQFKRQIIGLRGIVRMEHLSSANFNDMFKAFSVFRIILYIISIVQLKNFGGFKLCNSTIGDASFRNRIYSAIPANSRV